MRRRMINFALGVSILVGLAGMTRTRAIEGQPAWACSPASGSATR